MKVAELLELRRQNWQELERLCDAVGRKRKKRLGAENVLRFATLYRAACADLALSDAYQLPPNTVQYLHRLVGRAHNQLYRSRKFDFAAWGQLFLFDTPQKIFNDRCLQFVFVLFWGAFLFAGFLAYSANIWPSFANDLLGEEHLKQMSESFSTPAEHGVWGAKAGAAGFYIHHNAWIGLQCFVFSMLIVPGLVILIFNAATLGATFGYMFRSEYADNFQTFVTAHGPFELTAIVLSAGAGLRMGWSILVTHGWRRPASLRIAAKESTPMIIAAVMLFVLAAFIEGFISPSSLSYTVKATVAILSTGALLFYFIALGFPRSTQRGIG